MTECQETVEALEKRMAANVVPFAPTSAYEDQPAVEPTQRKKPLQWSTLAQQQPPEREWAINHWLGIGHVTLLAGAGGLGKTSVAQVLGSCVALGMDYLDHVPQARNVLMWAGEDDENELWRRQIAIASSLNVQLDVFDERFVMHSYDGEDVELCAVKDGVVAMSPMVEELTQQIGDYKAQLVILDNIARLYGCNENDRHQVTTFIAMLTKAARPTGASILLLGHPAKGPQSEYSGSTAWEGAARSRLYMGRTLPGKEQVEEEAPDDGVRYLCRRKANYTTRDYRKIQYLNGVMVPDDPPKAMTNRPTEYGRDVVIRAITHLERLGKWGTASTSSPDYLPKLVGNYNLLEGIAPKAFAQAMRELELSGAIKSEVVGQYPNRTPKRGLRVVSSSAQVERTNGM